MAPIIDASLVRRLIATQFPSWAGLSVSPVSAGGWDNKTFRLGDDLLVRMPSAEVYASQVGKEQWWLPKLASKLPVPVPSPVAIGRPSEDYPWEWSVYRWIEGEAATTGLIGDVRAFGSDLAHFLTALHLIDASGGPTAGRHNFHRGGPLSIYDAETRQAIEMLGGKAEAKAATVIWEAALSTSWHKRPVWVHGDFARSNLLVKDGRLCGVIDFGMSGVGDPACDLAIAWTLSDECRGAFRAAMSLDAADWARGRGWALWKALISVTGIVDGPATDMTLETILNDRNAFVTSTVA